MNSVTSFSYPLVTHLWDHRCL